MVTNEISFSQLIEFYKKNQIPTFDDNIDKYGGFFITAARIAAVILAPDPLTAIVNFCSGIDAGALRTSKLLSWLPDKFKYGNKGREKLSIQRYELSANINLTLLLIAIKNEVKETIMPFIESKLTSRILSDFEKDELLKNCNENDSVLEVLAIPTHCIISKETIRELALPTITPFFAIFSEGNNSREKITERTARINEENSQASESILKDYLERIFLNYQAYLVNFSQEFPEFALWINLNQKSAILNILNSNIKILEQNKINQNLMVLQTKEILEKIEAIRKDTFDRKPGFQTFSENYQAIFKVHDANLSKEIDSKILSYIIAHQRDITSEIHKPLSENTDLDNVTYPKNYEIYIAQSFEAISYFKKDHQKGFLSTKSLGENSYRGENIGNYLLRLITNPVSSLSPIIILGNPGAGKSMLSKMFAAELCKTTDFIPFLIKLRTVASSSSSIVEHINKGLANSIDTNFELDWMEWAKSFKDRTPVIIMDGFDELMQTNNRELNGYVLAIREFQQKAMHHDICVRVILTSRITVMEEVSIPDNTTIIKLDGFDEKRQQLWIELWNSFQSNRKYKFAIPKNDKIEILAKEPLLLFMLAVYDFENSELQKIVSDRNFNQSKLYSSLLTSFISRQLEKILLYKNINSKVKEKEKELFRNRLGMIAVMMFINDTTSSDTQSLFEELSAFGLHRSALQNENILGGFFFIHENKSISELKVEKFNYEFLHKTFGEFLVADFLLKVMLKQYDRVLNNNQEIIASKATFHFCFGYNWLHKHHNILAFLFEHSKEILKYESNAITFAINNIIKNDIREIFDKIFQSFPVIEFRLVEKKTTIEHLAIYSQNLIFLWAAIANENIIFDIYEIEKGNTTLLKNSTYSAQDSDEMNKNKLLWKRLSRLWTLVANYSGTAKLNEWIEIIENEEEIILKKNPSQIQNNHYNSSIVACNDFDYMLSLFDNELRINSFMNISANIENIFQKKNELTALGVDALIYRLPELYRLEKIKVISIILKCQLNESQEILFLETINKMVQDEDPDVTAKIIVKIKDHISFFQGNIRSRNLFLKLFVKVKQYGFVDELFDNELFHFESLYNFDEKDFAENKFHTIELLKTINELNNFFPILSSTRQNLINKFVSIISHETHKINDASSLFLFQSLEILNICGENLGSPYWQPKNLQAVVYEIMKSLVIITKSNGQLTFQFLKLIRKTCTIFFLNHIVFDQTLIRDTVNGILKEGNSLFFNNPDLFLEFSIILEQFNFNIKIDKILQQELVKNITSNIPLEFTRILRVESSKATLYFKAIKKIEKTSMNKYSLVWNTVKVCIENVTPKTELEYMKNIQSILTWLEIILLYNLNTESKKASELLRKTITSLSLKKHSDRALFQIIILLVEYNVSEDYILTIISKNPFVKKIYTSFPHLIKEMDLALKD